MVWWSELLTTNHEVPGSIPGSTMGIFPCRGRIPVVTMVWVVSRIRLKFETSVSTQSTMIESTTEISSLEGTSPRQTASTSAHRVPNTLIADYGRKKNLVGILFPHINDDARSDSLQICNSMLFKL